MNFNLAPDITQQLNSLQNFSAGRGIKIGFWENGGMHYIPYNYNSSGLVLMMLPIQVLVNNTVTSALILELINVLSFGFFLYKMNRLLDTDPSLEKVSLILFAVLVSPFVYHWPADSLSMTFCLWGIYFSFRQSYLGQFDNLIIAIMFMALGYLVKYSYFPFLFFPFLTYLLSPLCLGKRTFSGAASVLMVTVFFGVITFFLNYLFIGQRTNEITAGWTFQLWPLLMTDGFLFHLGNYEQVIEKGWSSFTNTKLNFSVVSRVITVGILCLTLRFIILKNGKKNKVTSMLARYSLLAFLILWGFLGLLSCLVPPVLVDKKLWTFVSNARYFSPVIILTFMFLVWWLFDYCSRKYFMFLCLCIFILNLLSFRSLLRVGNYGNTFFRYRKIQDQFQLGSIASQPNTVVYYDSLSLNTAELMTIYSRGIPIAPLSTLESEVKQGGGIVPFLLLAGDDGKLRLAPLQ